MDVLEILRLTLRYLHLVGFAVLFGGYVAQYLSARPRVTVPMRAGLGVMMATGLLLAIPFPKDIDLDYAKLGVKFAIAFVIGALLGLAYKRGEAVARWHFNTLGVLLLLNAAVAVFWR